MKVLVEYGPPRPGLTGVARLEAQAVGADDEESTIGEGQHVEKRVVDRGRGRDARPRSAAIGRGEQGTAMAGRPAAARVGEGDAREHAGHGSRRLRPGGAGVVRKHDHAVRADSDEPWTGRGEVEQQGLCRRAGEQGRFIAAMRRGEHGHGKAGHEGDAPEEPPSAVLPPTPRKGRRRGSKPSSTKPAKRS